MSATAKKIEKLSEKALAVLEAVFEGLSSEEIKDKHGLKGLGYTSIEKKLIKEGLISDEDGELVPSDDVVAYFESDEDSAEDEEGEDEVEETEEAEDVEEDTEAEADEEATAEVASVKEACDAVNDLIDPEKKLKTAADLKKLVCQKNCVFEAEDKNELDAAVVAKLEEIATANNKALPWMAKPEKAKGKADKAKAKDKAPGKAKAKAKDKAPIATSKYGSREGSQAYEIDVLLEKGKSTIEQIAEACGVTAGRVNLHLNHLRKKKGFEVTKSKDGAIKVK